MEAVFTFHSTHAAMSGEQTMLDGGLKVKVMPLPACLGAGCGLCLRINSDDLNAARGLLDQAGLTPQGIYLKRTEDGAAVYQPVTN